MFVKTMFPKLMIVLDVCAAAVYLSGGEYARCGYWLCAGALTFFTLIM